ncbi:MAG: homocysteine S-methyltransferase family protein, partial [bacterium]
MNFYEELENRVLLADGAMGTLLYAKGVPKGQCYDELNISNPELVESIHREYIEAGADIIETNTFGANRYILERYYNLGKKTRLINL